MAHSTTSRKPAPPAVSAREARRTLADLLGRTEYGGERIRIMKRDRVVAVLIPVKDLERLEGAA